MSLSISTLSCESLPARTGDDGNGEGIEHSMRDISPAISDQGLIAERDYWLQRLSSDTVSANLSLDHLRPSVYTSATEVVDLQLDEEVNQKLTRLTGDKPFLLLAALMTALKVCLYKYTGNRTIVVGTPARKQDTGAHETANVVLVVDELDDGLSFRQLLLNVRQTLLETYAHQHYPFELLVKDLGLANVKQKCPLFDVALVLTDIHVTLPEVRNDLTLTFTKKETGMSSGIAFNATLFDRQSIARFRLHFITVLRQGLENTETLLGDMDILTQGERRRLISEWNGSALDYPKDRCIHHLFEAQVARTPEGHALIFGDERLTYETLNRRANQLAHHLRALGIGPETLVGLCLDRSVELVIGLLGILKAGAAYVPLDPSYPKERLSFMLEDAGISVLLTRQGLVEKLSEHQARIVLMDRLQESSSTESTDNPVVETRPENLAYVIYTSGSTGQPKGVMVQHLSLVATIVALMDAYKLETKDSLLQFVSPSFDAFAEELYPTLCSGATLVLHPQPTELTPAQVISLIEALRITTLHIPPAYLSPLVEELQGMARGRLDSVRLFITGGESLPVERLAQLKSLGQPALRFINAYGPTEATITTTLYEASTEAAELAQWSSVPIGRPITHAQVYLLGRGLQLVPIGAEGELHIGGAGLARGYLASPELTAERFIPHPFSSAEGARLYRTGDVARYRQDGQLEFSGRHDEQVKLHGHRIELREIEAALKQHPAIREAVVQVFDHDHQLKRLVAHLLPERNQAAGEGRDDAAAPTAHQLRAFLKEKLPEHMIPAAFVILDALPLMPNGKVNRRALMVSDQAPPALENEYLAPRTATEEKLVSIWAELFKIERVGVKDNFLDLGGHSLLAFQLVSRLRDLFQLELPLGSVFESPTIAELAVTITHKLAQQRDEEKIKQLLAEIEQLPPDEIEHALDQAGN
jgi:amino acid adenylation domain-containing protein